MVVCVVPVEVRDALLKPEEIVHGAEDDVDCCCVASLRSEVVLEVRVVTFAKKLEKSKQTLREEVVPKNPAEN